VNDVGSLMNVVGNPNPLMVLVEVISLKSVYLQKIHTFILSEQLLALCKEYHAKICQIESTKYDTEKEVEHKEYLVPIIVKETIKKFDN